MNALNINSSHSPTVSRASACHTGVYVVQVCLCVIQVVQAVGKSYHRSCFRCSCCNECLGEAPFTVDSDKHLLCLHDYYRCVIVLIQVCYCIVLIQVCYSAVTDVL